MNFEFSKILKGDKTVWIIVFILALIAVPVVYSASGLEAFSSKDGNTDSYLYKQILALVFGMFIVYTAHIVPFKLYLVISKYFIYIAVALLIFTLFFGAEKNGARRWINVFGVFDLQTSELGKLSLIMYTARLLALNYADRIDLKKAVVKISLATFVVVGLIVPEGFSMALIVLIIIFTLLYISRVDVSKMLKIVGIVVLAVGLFYLLTKLFNIRNRFDTVETRIVEAYTGQQVAIAKAAIVKGGFFGEGPGNGVMKYVFSQSHNDFVYAYLVEEYGFITGIIILGFYLILFYRGINIAKNSNKPFAMFLTIGLTLQIVLQAMFHIAVAVNLIPPTGQTLPFLSSGLTSLVVSSFAVGVILNVSRLSETKNSEINQTNTKTEVNYVSQ